MPAVSPKRISWLKFEPRVSNFPVTKTTIAVLVASAIKTNLLFFYLLLNDGSFAKVNLRLLRKVLCPLFISFYFYLQRLSSLCGGRCTSGWWCLGE